MAGTGRITVAAVQCSAALGAVDRNLAEHKRWLDEAQRAEADLVVFPELSLTGYGLGEHIGSVAIRRDSPVLRELADAAGSVRAVVGFVEEGPGALLYNAAAVLRQGQVEAVHRKLNLPTYGRLEEGKWFAAGTKLDLVDMAEPWQGAVLICADLWNPALVHIAACRGAGIVLAPTASALGVVAEGFSNPDGWATVLAFYAMIYGMPMVMANRCGREGDVVFWGGSRILDAFGQTVASVGHDREGMAVADLDWEAVRRARLRLPTRRDANDALVAREFSRLAGGVP